MSVLKWTLAVCAKCSVFVACCISKEALILLTPRDNKQRQEVEKSILFLDQNVKELTLKSLTH